MFDQLGLKKNTSEDRILENMEETESFDQFIHNLLVNNYAIDKDPDFSSFPNICDLIIKEEFLDYEDAGKKNDIMEIF